MYVLLEKVDSHCYVWVLEGRHTLQGNESIRPKIGNIIRKIIIDPKQMLAGGGYVGLPGEIALFCLFIPMIS